MKNKIIKARKTIIACVICSIIFGTIGVGASTLLYSKDVTYDNSSSGLSSTNLQDALDELYEQAKNAPSCDSEGNCTVECPSGQRLILKSSTTYKCGNTAEQLKENVVTSGSGLYADTAESGRYIYRGSSPSNYITFNDETWRIMSVESDGTIKIIRDESIGNYAWDAAGTRSSSTSTYCTNASDYGCNAWAATSNLVGTPVNFTLYFPNGNPTSYTETYTGTVTGDASLNTYLNTTYYNSISTTAQSYIINHNFNVGTPGSGIDTENVATDVSQESIYKWNGKIALMTITEFMRTTTSTSCTSLNAGMNSITACSSNNWVFKSTTEWALSPGGNAGRSDVWHVNSDGIIGGKDYTNHVKYPRGVRPVVFLSSDITLTGSGAIGDPYTIN